MSYKGKTKGKTITFWERDDTHRLNKREVPESKCKTPKKESKRWKESLDNGRLYSSFAPHTPHAPIKGYHEVLGSNGWQHVPNNTCV